MADRRLPPSLTEDDTSAPIGDAPRWVLRHLLAAIAAFLAAVVLGVLLPARTEWVAGALLSVASVGVVASVARRYAQCRLGLSRRALSYLRWALFFIACFGLPGRWLVGSGAAVALLVWTFVDRRRVESLRARASDVLDAAGAPASEPAPDHPGAHVDRRVQTPAGVRILATPDVGWLAAPAEDLADRGRIAWAAAHYRALVGPQDARPELARVLRAFALLRHPNGTALMRVSGGEDLVVVTVDVHPRAEALRAARRAGTPRLTVVSSAGTPSGSPTSTCSSRPRSRGPGSPAPPSGSGSSSRPPTAQQVTSATSGRTRSSTPSWSSGGRTPISRPCGGAYRPSTPSSPPWTSGGKRPDGTVPFVLLQKGTSRARAVDRLDGGSVVSPVGLRK